MVKNKIIQLFLLWIPSILGILCVYGISNILPNQYKLSVVPSSEEIIAFDEAGTFRVMTNNDLNNYPDTRVIRSADDYINFYVTSKSTNTPSKVNSYNPSTMIYDRQRNVWLAVVAPDNNDSGTTPEQASTLNPSRFTVWEKNGIAFLPQTRTIIISPEKTVTRPVYAIIFKPDPIPQRIGSINDISLKVNVTLGTNFSDPSARPFSWSADKRPNIRFSLNAPSFEHEPEDLSPEFLLDPGRYVSYRWVMRPKDKVEGRHYIGIDYTINYIDPIFGTTELKDTDGVTYNLDIIPPLGIPSWLAAVIAALIAPLLKDVLVDFINKRRWINVKSKKNEKEFLSSTMSEENKQ